ncbi:MAG: hypothetical protein ACON4R_15215 [Akkermansiaceae bacterium]
MDRLKSVTLSILRIIAILLLFLGLAGLAGLAYLVYSPGEAITDDRHDLETNEIWLQHNWVGNDEWFEDTPLLLRLPSYHDAGTGYHRPEVENLLTSLRGIHPGLGSMGDMPENYHGVYLCSE